MAAKSESRVINMAGLVQGIVLVTFPATSTIFTSSKYYSLSSSQYGSLFLPQVLLAIAGSLLGARLAQRITTKRVYLVGLAASLTAMALLLVSALVKADQAIAYPLLLIATAGIVVFGIAGLGCSALLPLTISFGEEELTAMAGAVTGGIIALYQLGYGIAAFGVGPLQSAGIGLSAIFGGTAIVAVAMAGLSFLVARSRPSAQPEPPAAEEAR